MAHPDNVGRRGGLAEHRSHRIARHQVDDREGQGRDAKCDRHEREESPERIANHCDGSPPSELTSVRVASERKLPLGSASKPTSRRFITATLSTHHSDTYGRSSAASCCTCA